MDVNKALNGLIADYGPQTKPIRYRRERLAQYFASPSAQPKYQASFQHVVHLKEFLGILFHIKIY